MRLILKTSETFVRHWQNRPRGSRAAEKRNEVAALHSITSSAVASSDDAQPVSPVSTS
jgi:hypothetical protein